MSSLRHADNINFNAKQGEKFSVNSKMFLSRNSSPWSYLNVCIEMLILDGSKRTAKTV